MDAQASTPPASRRVRVRTTKRATPREPLAPDLRTPSGRLLPY